MRLHQSDKDYTDQAVCSRVREKFQDALNHPSHAKRLTILSDIAKSISKDVIEVDLPISMGQVAFRMITETQAKKMGTTRAAFYRLIRDAAVSIASEYSSIASCHTSEGEKGLQAIAKAEEHMRLAGLCETLMQVDEYDNTPHMARMLKKAMEKLAFSTGITQDYLKNQHLYHVLMA